MKFYGTDYGNVSNASGARNLVGQGYWYQIPTRALCDATWAGAGTIFKTTPVYPRNGNMDVKADRMTPREWFPKCIIIKPLERIGLNAVGLTSPGLQYLLNLDIWQNWDEPATISLMAVGRTLDDRIREMYAAVDLLMPQLKRFKNPIKIELNISCPNTGHNQRELVAEAKTLVLILKKLNVAVTVKLNVLTSHDAAIEIAYYCDGLVVGNTVLFGQLPHKIPWKKLFGSDISPLKKFGGGGLSGAPLRDLHCEWIATARDLGIRKPIEGCGGISSVEDAMCYRDAGASGIQLGIIGLVAPWNQRSVIEYANDPSTIWWNS